MMLVKILGFGSNWWARFGRDPLDRYRFTRHAAYFNSTGVRCGNKMKRYWIVPGLIRFNGVGEFNPHFPNRALGETFECADLTFACGGNRLLFRRKAVQSATPDFYLVVLSSDRFGRFNFEDHEWQSDSPTLIAVSNMYEKQEAMALMKAGNRVRSTVGIWQLRVAADRQHIASMELVGATVQH